LLVVGDRGVFVCFLLFPKGVIAMDHKVYAAIHAEVVAEMTKQANAGNTVKSIIGAAKASGSKVIDAAKKLQLKETIKDALKSGSQNATGFFRADDVLMKNHLRPHNGVLSDAELNKGVLKARIVRGMLAGGGVAGAGVGGAAMLGKKD